MPKIYKVGGVIRDAILGIENKDVDFTFVLEDTNITVEEGFRIMSDWMKEEGYEIFLSTPSCFTIRAKFPLSSVHAGLVADFVLARKEVGYIEGTRRPKLELGSLYDDLERRDFTVNAMAEDENGNIIDMFNGEQDLEDRILRTPIDPRITMMDDPLRILRCWRFSITKGFTIDQSIVDAMKNPEILNKLEKVVSKERIREELTKMFKHNTIATLQLLFEMNKVIPDLYNILFSHMWLKPTTEK
jgi:tRNA nucleotidyltransferase/poly(A) polymerase